MISENEKKFNKSENITQRTQSYILSTIHNTSLFVIMSVVTKILNLFFNVLIARIISKESYGLATVYFIFIYILILYFPRELLRKTCLKYCPDEREEKENEKFNEGCQLTWIINFLILLASFPIVFIFIKFGGGNGDSKNLAEYTMHLVLYVFSAFIELIAEPIVIYLNIKIDKTNRLIGMTLSHYVKLILNYYFAYAYGLDLWSFTLSRVFSSLFYLLYMLYVGLCIYQLKFVNLLPNLKKIILVLKNKELKGILLTFVQGTTLKLVLTYSEKIVLSFFLMTSDSDKAEYTFIAENYVTFIKYLIEPAEENFYNLINKIKNYKGLTVALSNFEHTTGDFSHSENEILIKLYSSLKNKKIDKETYSYKLLKLWLKLFYVFAILLCCYIHLIGKELIILIYTEKWGTEHAINILKVYSIYVGIIAINGIVESYAQAICSADRIHKANSFLTLNAILLVFLSITMAKYDTTGLVWANSIVLLLRFFFSVYLIVCSELESQQDDNSDGENINDGVIEFEMENISESVSKNEEGVKDDRYIKKNVNLSVHCIRYTQIFHEILKFLSKSFLKLSAILATMICLLFLNLIKDFLDEDGNQMMLVLIACLILTINTALIFILEKKGFIEIFRLRTSGVKRGFI